MLGSVFRGMITNLQTPGFVPLRQKFSGWKRGLAAPVELHEEKTLGIIAPANGL
jgi:hypothetical protein